MVLKYEEEINLITGLLSEAGFPEYDAATMAKVITHSDFTGVYSHGLSRLTRYLRQIENGVLNPKAVRTKVVDTEAVTVYDCDNGSGIVNVNLAYDELLPKAKKYGIALATGRRSANIGCGSYYGWRAAADNMIAVVTCNTYCFSAPFGGADLLLGTNPVIVAIPTDKEYPMVLDMSTTNVASGKIQAAQREGKEIPLGWANDINGNPTTDPNAAYSLLPIAAHKGYGLQVMVDIMSTMLSKAAYGTDIGLYSKLEPENTGFCLVLINPSKFMPAEEFTANADRYVRMFKDSRKADGVSEIFMPGEIEYRKMLENKKTGMNFSEKLEAELADLAAALGAVPKGTPFAELVKKYNA